MVHIHINKEKTEGCCEELTENMQQVWILFRAFFRKAKAKLEVWKYFTKDGTEAYCKHCSKDYAADSRKHGTL
jgi:carboxylesterase type B